MDRDPALSGYQQAVEEESTDNRELAKEDLNYASLKKVLKAAYDRAAHGKGKVRHANGLPFEEQPICRLIYSFGEHCWDGQLGKKIAEADSLDFEAGNNELLDCIVYIAGRIVARQKNKKNE